MIEKLKKKDIVEAAKVFNKGLSMEIPKGYATLDETTALLNKIHTFVHKTNSKIDGLLSFEYKNKDKIKIKFICALNLRKGIGKKLIKKLVNFALRKRIKFIYSNVSTKDKRVMKFYESCGFKKYGQYYARKDFLLHRVKAKPEKINKAFKID